MNLNAFALIKNTMERKGEKVSVKEELELLSSEKQQREKKHPKRTSWL